MGTAQSLASVGSSVRSESVRLASGMLLMSSDPEDDEATAAAGILMQRTSQQTLSLRSSGISLLADQGEMSEEEQMIAIRDADAVVVLLTRGSLRSVLQLRVLLTAIDVAEHTQKTPGSGPFELVPVSVQGFEFPTGSNLAATLAEVFPEAHAKAQTNLKFFFKRISIFLSTNASIEIIDAQA